MGECDQSATSKGLQGCQVLQVQLHPSIFTVKGEDEDLGSHGPASDLTIRVQTAIPPLKGQGQGRRGRWVSQCFPWKGSRKCFHLFRNQ